MLGISTLCFEFTNYACNIRTSLQTNMQCINFFSFLLDSETTLFGSWIPEFSVDLLSLSKVYIKFTTLYNILSVVSATADFILKHVFNTIVKNS